MSGAACCWKVRKSSVWLSSPKYRAWRLPVAPRPTRWQSVRVRAYSPPRAAWAEVRVASASTRLSWEATCHTRGPRNCTFDVAEAGGPGDVELDDRARPGRRRRPTRASRARWRRRPRRGGRRDGGRRPTPSTSIQSITTIGAVDGDPGGHRRPAPGRPWRASLRAANTSGPSPATEPRASSPVGPSTRRPANRPCGLVRRARSRRGRRSRCGRRRWRPARAGRRAASATAAGTPAGGASVTGVQSSRSMSATRL